MIIVIVNHIAKSGMLDEGILRINKNGALMEEIPGFRFRYLTISKENPAKLTTVTAWEQEEDFNNWLAYKRKMEESMDSESIYESAKREIFTVLDK